MLFSLGLIFLCGMLLGSVFQKLKLPGLLGMLFAGILLGPYALGLLDAKILSISAELRQIALIIILLRAGLALDIKDLLSVGRPAVLMCFVPACFEIAGMVLIAPMLFDVTVLDAAIMGATVAAVSPAVVVPRMLWLMEMGYGTAEGVPQLVMAGAAADDVFVIVLFASFTKLAQGEKISFINFAQIPVSILSGLLAGIVLGILFAKFFRAVSMRDSVKAVVFLGVSCLLVALENMLAGIFPFSGLLAIMSMGAALLKKHTDAAARLSAKFSKLWVAAEILLFALVGAAVDVRYAISAGLSALLLIFAVLAFRMLGVFCCMLKTRLSVKERAFCMLAYIPKATVQAAIGPIPLAMGLSCGKVVLTVAVLSILITAPLGAFLIDMTYRRLLKKAADQENAFL